jgi:UDP-N-acetylmuramoylalanine-D-glutamate ligase
MVFINGSTASAPNATQCSISDFKSIFYMVCATYNDITQDSLYVNKHV